MIEQQIPNLLQHEHHTCHNEQASLQWQQLLAHFILKQGTNTLVMHNLHIHHLLLEDHRLLPWTTSNNM